MGTIIDLVRHGEPEGGRAYRGNRIDDPLSETGWTQMRNLVDDTVSWEMVVTSPLRRCSEFASEVANRLDLPYEVIEDLKEVGFGSWEGKTPDQIQASDPEAYRSFYRDPVTCRPQGAEPLDTFFMRASGAYDTVVEKYDGQHVLLVTHAGIIRAIVAAVLKAPIMSMYKLRIDYAGLCRISYDGQLAKLDAFNSDRYRKVK